MKRIGAALGASLAVTLLFVGPAAASSDTAPHTPPPPPSHPTASDPPSEPTFSVPPSTPPAPPSHPVAPSHPAAPSAGSAVSDVAKGLGQSVSQSARSGDTGAIHTAIDDHSTAVTTVAHGGAPGDAAPNMDPDPNGGNAANATGFGAQVSALARASGGAKGETVSAFAKTLGELVRSGALTLGEGGERVSSADDPDLALDSGLTADDAGEAGNALPDAVFPQLSA